MRKSAFSSFIAASLLTAAFFSVSPIHAKPAAAPPQHAALLAQGNLDLPGDLPGSNAPNSQNSGHPPRSASSDSSRHSTYGSPVDGSTVPPDIVDAPLPYPAANSGAQQQEQIISRISPHIVAPGSVIIPGDFDQRPSVGILKTDSKGFIIPEPVKLANDAQFYSS